MAALGGLLALRRLALLQHRTFRLAAFRAHLYAKLGDFSATSSSGFISFLSIFSRIFSVIISKASGTFWPVLAETSMYTRLSFLA